MNIAPIQTVPTTTPVGLPGGPDNPCIFPPLFTPAEVATKYSNDFRQLGATSLLPSLDAIQLQFGNGEDAHLAQSVLRPVIDGVKVIAEWNDRMLRPNATLQQSADLIGRIDAVRAVNVLADAHQINVVTQDVASADRLRGLLADQVQGYDVTVTPSLRFHPSAS